MQKIKIISIGKVKNSSIKKEIGELSRRISRLEIIELKEVKGNNDEEIKKKEYELLLKYIDLSNENCILWEGGKEFTTKTFCSKIRSQKPMQFIITGPFGPSDDLKKLIESHLSLSKMTFTHEQALYMLVEQLYRCQCIEKNIPYNK